MVSLATSVQRCAWLSCCREIAYLGTAGVAKLVHHLTQEVFTDGDLVYLKNKVDSKLMLVEHGTLYIGILVYTKI